ncbi:MAG: LamG domain-containing protein, partial [Candidatus Methanoperedens sp.]
MRKRKSMAVCLFSLCVAVALVLAGTAVGEVSRNGLVAEYHFDGDAKDSSGNGNDGVIHGTTFVDGKFGKALSFDGANNYVNVAGVWGGTSWKEATIEAWVSTKTTSGDFQAIVSSTSADFVHLQLNSWGNIAIFTDNIKPYIALPIISQKPTGIWRHIAISIKSGNTKLYENGVEVGFDSSTFSYLTHAAELHIGNGYQNGRFFNGLIDEVRIYNRALSAEEIKANYKAGQTAP